MNLLRYPQALLFSLALSGAAVSLSVSDAQAQSNAIVVANPWDDARDAYRLQDWPAAQRFAAMAVQREPDEPRYYLALARITFQQNAVEEAVWFYDTFLSLAKARGVDFPGSYSVARAEAERASANARRANPDAPSEEPEVQRRVREAFLQRLSEGPVVSGFAGAYATFQTLVQLGYANPDFSELRKRLHEAALQEAEAIFASNEGRLPTLTLSGVEEQLRRYDAANALVPAPTPFDGAGDLAERESRTQTLRQANETAVRRATLRAQREYMHGNYAQAEELFRSALALDEKDPYAHQGLINTLIAADAERDAILLAIAKFETAFPSHSSLPIYKALGESAVRAHRHAASMLYDFLIRP